jgi:hypothetical protein
VVLVPVVLVPVVLVPVVLVPVVVGELPSVHSSTFIVYSVSVAPVVMWYTPVPSAIKKDLVSPALTFGDAILRSSPDLLSSYIPTLTPAPIPAFGVAVVETVTRKLGLFVANDSNALPVRPGPPALSLNNTRAPRQLPGPGSGVTLPPDGSSSQAMPSLSASRL